MEIISLYIIHATEILHTHMYYTKIGVAADSSSSHIMCLECVLHVVTVPLVGYLMVPY
jgi:hypothetical protein